MKTKTSTTFFPERKGQNKPLYWYLLVISIILACALLFMAQFDLRAVAKQEEFLSEQQLLSTSLARLAWEDRFQSIQFQKSFLLDEVFLKVVRGEMTAVQAKAVLSPFVYNNTDLLGYCFVGTKKEIPPFLISAYRSTPSGNAAREFVEDFRSACDFPEMVTDFTENDPIFSLSGRIRITPERQMLILVAPLLREGSVPGYLLTVMDLSPFLVRYVVPMAKGADGTSVVIHEDGTIIQHKDTGLIGKNLRDPSGEFPPGLKEAWSRMQGEMSGKGEFLLAWEAGQKPKRKLLAWNSLRMGPKRMVIALTSSEAEINRALFDLRTQRDILGIFLVLLLLLATLLFLRRRGELEARRNEAGFQSIFNSASSAIAILDDRGRFLAGNSRWEEITGRSLGELRGVSLLDIGATSSREERELIHRALEQGAEFQRAELVFSGKNGTSSWADVTLNRLQRDGESPEQGYIAVVTDISGLKNAEEQLKKNTLLLQRQKMELQKQNSDQEILLALFAQFSRAKTMEDLFAILSRYLPSILSYRNLIVCLRSLDDPDIFHTVDLLGEIKTSGQSSFPREKKGIIGHVLSTGKPYVSGDLSADPHYISHSAEARSMVFVPVAYRGTIWGAVAIDSGRKDAYGPRRGIPSISSVPISPSTRKK